MSLVSLNKYGSDVVIFSRYTLQIRVVDPDPDPYWIRFQLGMWIRIRIRIRNTDPDPGGQK